MKRVLFVCTGNIFRSLTAEHALRRSLPADSQVTVSSAGTEDFPHVVRPNVLAYLGEKGYDVSKHRRRTLTREMIEQSDVVIAMSTDHRDFIQRQFGATVPVFLQACGGDAAALPDIEEVVADYRTNPAAVDAHVRMTIDRILELAPALASRIDALPGASRAPRYEFSFEATPELGTAAMKCMLRKRSRFAGPAALVLLPILLLILAQDPEWRTPAGVAGGAALMLFMIFLAAVWHRRKLRKRFFRDAPHRQVRAVIDDRGVAVSTALGEAQIRWEAIDRIWRCKDVALVLYQGWQYVAFPAQAIPSGALEYAESRSREKK